MSAESAALAGRVRAESMMADTCLVRRQTGQQFNEATGDYEPTFATLYDGKCRVQDPAAVNRQAEAGGYPWTVDTTILQLPVVSADYATDADTARQVVISKGDEVTVTALGPTTDPDLLGASMSVQGFGKRKSNPVYRSLICEAVS